VALTSADVGRRVVVRRVLHGERGPSGGQALTDVIGLLEQWESDFLVVRRKDDSTVRIAHADVVAAKTVPPPVTRSRSRPGDRPDPPGPAH
jgi:N-acetylglutamate synthase